jgi:hypothetical protein
MRRSRSAPLLEATTSALTHLSEEELSSSVPESTARMVGEAQHGSKIDEEGRTQNR